MTWLSVILFVLAALLILMACVKAQRVRSWRESLNPSAPEVPDAAFAVARIALIGVAIGCVVVGVRGLGVEDGSKWSDDELKRAVEQATYELDGSLYRVDESGEPVVHTDDHETRIETEVAENGGGDAPPERCRRRPGRRQLGRRRVLQRLRERRGRRILRPHRARALEEGRLHAAGPRRGHLDPVGLPARRDVA
ncbi:hypothetical protein RKD49_005750 [Streptomyces glaucescens]